MDQLVHTAWDDVAKEEILVPAVCVTCMSGNRTLYAMNGLMHLSNVCNGVQLSPEDHICWECKAILRRFAKFRDKAFEARSALTVWQEMNQGQYSKMKAIMFPSLSTLGFSQFSCYDTVDSDVEEGLDMEVEIKDDILDIKEEANPIAEDQPAEIKDFVLSETEELENQDKNCTVKHLSEKEMLSFRESERASTRFIKAAFKCDFCIKYFRNAQAFALHMVLHSESEGSLQCGVCFLRFPDVGTLSSHVKIHYRCYECNACGLRFAEHRNMCKHWKRNHTVKKKCAICKDEFASTAELKEHQRASHASDVTCAECGKVFSNKYLVRRHEALIHSTDVPLVECDVCRKQFRGESRLRQHKRVHENSANENAFCAECGVQFKNLYLYHVHLKTAARHLAPADRKYECSDCGKRFVAKAYVKLHIELVHLKKANYQCDICGLRLNARLLVSRHKREKHAARSRPRIICDVCGKVFTVRKCLIEHKNVHSGARPFECKLCTATFSYSAALYNHNRLVHLKKGRGRKS